MPAPSGSPASWPPTAQLFTLEYGMADAGTGTVSCSPQCPSVTVWLSPLATVVSLMGSAPVVAARMSLSLIFVLDPLAVVFQSRM